MKFKSKDEIKKENLEKHGEVLSNFLNVIPNYTPTVFDEDWEEVKIESGVQQINEELEEGNNEQANDNSNISESESN